MNKSLIDYCLISGIVAPIFITILIIILGFYHPNYNHIVQYMSELGAINAPYSNIMNFGFGFFGLLIIFFSYGLFNKFYYGNKEILILFAFILIGISGLSFFLIGFFPCDPNCINFSSTGIIHSYLSDSANYTLILAQIFLIKSFKENNKFKNIYTYTLLSSILVIIFCIIYEINIFQNYIGLIQRISFGIPILWIEIIAIKIYKLN
jgi:hypothetical membrane protein